MSILQSTRFTAEALVRYTKLPVRRINLMDEKTNDFIGRLGLREGCPLKEKQLAEQIINSIHHLTRQLNLTRVERQEIQHEADSLKRSAHRKSDDMYALGLIVQRLLDSDK